jgi:cyanophycinase
VAKKRGGELVIIGGREDREGDKPILEEVVRLAGGKGARIAVMPIASEVPEEMAQMYTEAFTAIGVKAVDVLQIADREGAFNSEYERTLSEATGVFFTGGSQLRIISLLGGTRLAEVIMSRNADDGLVVAGTSAGASMMADTMILNGIADSAPEFGGVELGSGLGLFPKTVIDQHFAERGRVFRLITAVAQHPGYLGIGIDENTALVKEDGRFRVIGEGAVSVFNAEQMRYNNFPTVQEGEPLALDSIRIAIIPNGYGYDLTQKCLLTPEELGLKKAAKR